MLFGKQICKIKGHNWKILSSARDDKFRLITIYKCHRCGAMQEITGR